MRQRRHAHGRSRRQAPRRKIVEIEAVERGIVALEVGEEDPRKKNSRDAEAKRRVVALI
jgi:hypothetical protein